MFRRHGSATCRSLGSAAAVGLFALMPANGQTIKPDQVAYDVKTSEDPAAKACILALAIKDSVTAETVDFRLVVARMKRADALAGPAVFGFTIAVHGQLAAPQRKSEPRAIEISSAAFTSERYVAAAHRGTMPFAGGSWVAATLDATEGGELVDATADGNFQIAYTRARPTAARVYDVTSAPPRDVAGRFSGCVDGLQAIE